MFWAFRQLSTPFRYLAIRHGGGLLKSKGTYDWVLPAIAAIILAALSTWLGTNQPLFAEHSIMGGFQQLLAILIPFYIVALAAVATFAGPGMDEYLKGGPAYIMRLRPDGKRYVYELNRRQFICYLFGYLSAVSMAVFVVVLVGGVVEGKIGSYICNFLGNATGYLKFFGLVFSLFWICQIIVITLLGIAFISDRIHVTANPEV